MFEDSAVAPYHIEMRAPVIPLIAAVLSWGALGLPAPAQQEFKLGEDDRWLELEAADPATPEGQLAEARRALANEEYTRAHRLANQWIERHDRHPLLAQAYLTRADAMVGLDDEYEALFDYEYIARMFPGNEVFITALERELTIAKMYAAGRYRKLWGMRILNAEAEAEELFIRVQERLPGSRLAEDAGMQLGDFYFERQRMTLAAEAYALFIENYPRSEQLPKARRRLIYAHLASFKGPEFDARGLMEARSSLRQMHHAHPIEADKIAATGLIARIDESHAQKMLNTANWYIHADNPIAAEMTIRRLTKQYPRSVAAADALRLIPDILPKLPARVLAEAPNYAAMRAAVLGIHDESIPQQAPAESEAGGRKQ